LKRWYPISVETWRRSWLDVRCSGLVLVGELELERVKEEVGIED